MVIFNSYVKLPEGRFCPLYVRGYLHMYLLCMWMWLANTWCQRVNVLEHKAEHCTIPGCYIVDIKTSVSLGYNNLFVLMFFFLDDTWHFLFVHHHFVNRLTNWLAFCLFPWGKQTKWCGKPVVSRSMIYKCWVIHIFCMFTGWYIQIYPRLWTI
jgi:hypothetical protein